MKYLTTLILIMIYELIINYKIINYEDKLHEYIVSFQSKCMRVISVYKVSNVLFRALILLLDIPSAAHCLQIEIARINKLPA